MASRTSGRRGALGVFLRPLRYPLAYGAMVALLLALLSIHITDDWRHLHDDDGMHYSVIAYSHVQGARETGFHNAYRDPLSGAIVGRYLHHPPLLALAIAGVFKVTGITGYWVPRAVSITFHLIVLACTTWLAARLLERRWNAALLVAGGFALIPVSTYFGKAVVYPPITLAFSLLGMAAHFMALERLRLRQGGWWFPALLSVPVWVLAAFSGWFSHFLLAAAGLLALAVALRVTGRLRWQALGLAVGCALTSALGLAAVALHMYLVGGLDAFGDFLSVYRSRSGMEELEVMGSDYTAYAAKAVSLSMLRYLALGPALLTAGWLVLAGRRALRGGLTYADVWILTLLAPGLLYLIAANRGATQHPFYVYFLMPGVVLATVRMVLEGWARLPRLAPLRRRLAVAAAGVALTLSVLTSAAVLRYEYGTDDPFALDRVATLQILYTVPPGQRMFPPRAIRPRLPSFEAAPQPGIGAAWGIEAEPELARASAPPRRRA